MCRWVRLPPAPAAATSLRGSPAQSPPLTPILSLPSPSPRPGERGAPKKAALLAFGCSPSSPGRGRSSTSLPATPPRRSASRGLRAFADDLVGVLEPGRGVVSPTASAISAFLPFRSASLSHGQQLELVDEHRVGRHDAAHALLAGRRSQGILLVARALCPSSTT